MAETYRTRHRISGVIDENTAQHTLDAYRDVLEVVGPDAKPFLPEMHRVSLPLDATKDDLELARAAAFTNPSAFGGTIDEHKAEVAAQAEAAQAEAKTPTKKD